MWRLERRQPEKHPVRSALTIAGGALALAATAFGVWELAKRGKLGERAQAALGGGALGGDATIERAGFEVPHTATVTTVGATPATGSAEVPSETRFAEPGGPSERPAL